MSNHLLPSAAERVAKRSRCTTPVSVSRCYFCYHDPDSAGKSAASKFEVGQVRSQHGTSFMLQGEVVLRGSGGEEKGGSWKGLRLAKSPDNRRIHRPGSTRL